MATLQRKLDLASSFILQSPPGEENDVFNDLRTIVADDDALEQSIVTALQQYNEQQFVVAKHSDDDDNKNSNRSQVLITDAARDSVNETYSDPDRQQMFKFDHMKLTISDKSPIQVDQETEQIRSSISKVLKSYVENHYSQAVSTVYAFKDANYPEPEKTTVHNEPRQQQQTLEKTFEQTQEDASAPVEKQREENAQADEADGPEHGTFEAAAEAENGATVVMDQETLEQASESGQDTQLPTNDAENTTLDEPLVSTAQSTPPKPAQPSRVFGLYFVGNKYNPANYWTGRWRSKYVVDFEKRTIEGEANVNIHYYEQGNVQLSTTLRSSLNLDSTAPTPEQIVSLIKQSESSFSSQLSDAYTSLSSDIFKRLRRTLPRSKTKMSWEKAVVYKAGQDLRKS
ncbi:F-actin-capping protein subunit alpha [Microbotryomycetes sp. JL221]|nr:F-actin-capping protein subunit alpha [Microbotryomycetes sp. JL221]